MFVRLQEQIYSFFFSFFWWGGGKFMAFGNTFLKILDVCECVMSWLQAFMFVNWEYNLKKISSTPPPPKKKNKGIFKWKKNYNIFPAWGLPVSILWHRLSLPILRYYHEKKNGTCVSLFLKKKMYIIVPDRFSKRVTECEASSSNCSIICNRRLV